jgi:glutamyl-Q tRNA(Asp) synthetase
VYIGRFAPSPTGPLHAGSLVAALASWLDARAHGGTWLVRIEDVDTPRKVSGADVFILQQLQALGLVSDEPPVWQSKRSALYENALQCLRDKQLLYACTCSRKELEQALFARGITRERHGELRYLGHCRGAINSEVATHTLYSLRVITHINIGNHAITNNSMQTDQITQWHDRRLGSQQEDVQQTCGDFVLKRADGCYTYQLAVVVDDAAQGITHVVRGEDLADNTARQIVLQRHLGYARPLYLHTPLLRTSDGEKLSKQQGAQALDISTPLQTLHEAMQVLGLSLDITATRNIATLLGQATQAWADRYCIQPT